MSRFLILMAGLISSLTGCAQGDFDQHVQELYKGTVPLVKSDSLKQLANEQVYVLDTREKAEFEVSHLQNARWVGYDQFDMARVADIPKGAKVVVYCSVGYRSERIGEKLQEAGYQKVYNLYGGIFDWFNKENPIYAPSGETTTKIHTYNRKWGQWVKRGEKIW